MPGIAGIVTKKATGREREKIEAMLGCMLHESFYTHGVYENPANGYYIGFSAMPDSFADCMPIFNETKELILFLTGRMLFGSARHRWPRPPRPFFQSR